MILYALRHLHGGSSCDAAAPDCVPVQVPFTFGVEVFEPGHRTNPHTHALGHEMFVILSGACHASSARCLRRPQACLDRLEVAFAGEGTASCNGHTFPVCAGEVVVFPPTSLHAIDNGPHARMYCLELMCPNDMFAELVNTGRPAGRLKDEDLCALISVGCR